MPKTAVFIDLSESPERARHPRRPRVPLQLPMRDWECNYCGVAYSNENKTEKGEFCNLCTVLLEGAKFRLILAPTPKAPESSSESWDYPLAPASPSYEPQ